VRRTAAFALIGVALLAIVSLALAQVDGFDLSWHRVAGGGGTSADGGQYTLSGTIGQSEAGRLMEGSTFRLSGGYWGGAGPDPAINDLYLPMVLRPE
jgi:hypothetical protein